VNLVTPVPFGIARPLVSSLVSEVVVRPGGEDIAEVVPGPCLPYEEALRLALRRVRDADVETSWREAELAGRSPAEPYPGDPDWSGGTLLRDDQDRPRRRPAAAVFAAVSRSAADRGWPTHGWAWRLRGLDRPAHRRGRAARGRRDPDELRVGDALDFWRVEDVRGSTTRRAGGPAPARRDALPGRAWLEWRMRRRPTGPISGSGRCSHRAGCSAALYWWAMLPFHGFIFRSMAEALAADAVELAAAAAALGAAHQ
jgi:hypothetical protein